MDPLGDGCEGLDVIEDINQRAVGACSGRMNLWRGKYSMADYQTDVLIRKGTHLKKESHALLRNFTHENAVPILNFYPENNQGRLVIPEVTDSFMAWFQAGGKNLLFDEKQKMTTLYRTMLIELCDLIEKLIARRIVVKDVIMEDLYVKYVDSERPKLLLLLTEVEMSIHPAYVGRANWTSIREFIKWCRAQCCVNLDCGFSNFIGAQTFSAKMLKSYPDNWDYSIKGGYLLSLHSAGQSAMRILIRKTGVGWPYSGHVLPELLDKVIEDSESKGFVCNTKDSFEYNKLLKNAYKHFEDLPDYLKIQFGSREGFLTKVEEWSPNIWQKLYEIIGWP